MSAALSAQWGSACARLGVKPRQFAVLLSVTAVAVAALAARNALRPARPAKAAAPVAEAAQRATPAERLPVVELSLETRPARDPFRPFFLLADAAQDAGSAPVPAQAGGAAAAAPGTAAPAGLSLRAAIAGELAVVGEQTVGIGDELVDDAGRRFTVEEIHERRVVLREGMRRTELGYAQAAKAAAKGGRK